MGLTIDKTHLQEVCKLGHGAETCAFLMMAAEGMSCAKGTPVEPTIRARLAEGTMNAQGDNCPGYGRRTDGSVRV